MRKGGFGMAAQGPWGGGGGGKDDDKDRGKGGQTGGNRPESGQGGQNGGPPRPNRPWGAPPPSTPPGGERPGSGRDPGPRRPGQPPELDELVRKGQERLRVLMGGGGGNTPGRRPGGRGPNFSLNRSSLGIFALAAAAVWAFASFYTVNTGQKSVELLFGRPIAVGDEGLNFAPWPLVTKEIVDVTGERVTEIGNSPTGSASSNATVTTGSSRNAPPTDNGLMLTQDQNIVDVSYQVVWNVSDPQQYLFNLAEPEGTIKAVAESAMRDIVARTQLAPILNRDRGVIARDLEIAVQTTLDSYQAGINVARVNLDRADPPAEVRSAFLDVQSARQERDRLEKEADAYSARVQANARGEAAALVEQAEGYRAQAVNAAEGEAARFNSVYDEYVKAPDVTRRRMYLETMERVLGGVNKVILDQPAGGGQGVLPYLPLDSLTRQQQPAGAPQRQVPAAPPAAAPANTAATGGTN